MIKPTCPRCGSYKTNKVGSIPIVSTGIMKPRRKCFNCGKTFYAESDKTTLVRMPSQSKLKKKGKKGGK